MATPVSSPIARLQVRLHEALEPIGRLGKCALLHYPHYPNIGDHLIWLGSVLYLTQVAGASIGYAASSQNFSAVALDRAVGNAPILLLGGGNLGDLWTKEQQFREAIIQHYPDRPITILPQTIWFQNPDNALATARVFNAHPRLTLFVRDSVSYELALKYFDNCRIFLAPDLAFYLHPLPGLPWMPRDKSAVLYHTRKDLELHQRFSPEEMERSSVVVEDWVSYGWCYPWLPDYANTWYWQVPGIATLVRTVWQRWLATPQEWLSRQMWQWSGLYPLELWQSVYPWLHRRSWGLLHTGMYQFCQYPQIITDRLHGHILATLLEIPHIFLPNSYHKNEAFYQTWTQDIPFCQFAKDQETLKAALRELLVYSK